MKSLRFEMEQLKCERTGQKVPTWKAGGDGSAENLNRTSGVTSLRSAKEVSASTTSTPTKNLGESSRFIFCH